MNINHLPHKRAIHQVHELQQALVLYSDLEPGQNLVHTGSAVVEYARVFDPQHTAQYQIINEQDVINARKIDPWLKASTEPTIIFGKEQAFLIYQKRVQPLTYVQTVQLLDIIKPLESIGFRVTDDLVAKTYDLRFGDVLYFDDQYHIIKSSELKSAWNPNLIKKYPYNELVITVDTVEKQQDITNKISDPVTQRVIEQHQAKIKVVFQDKSKIFTEHTHNKMLVSQQMARMHSHCFFSNTLTHLQCLSKMLIKR